MLLEDEAEVIGAGEATRRERGPDAGDHPKENADDAERELAPRDGRAGGTTTRGR